MRAETFTTHFESVPNTVREVSPTIFFATRYSARGHSTYNSGGSHDLRCELKPQIAYGPDRVPAGFWQTICTEGSPACGWAVALCNLAWEGPHVPAQGHESWVRTIFKKGL